MGLIRATLSAAGDVLADQWKEFFYCDALAEHVLVVKAHKRVNGKSSNKGNDNVITNGSGIAVADGQCAIIVDQGRIVEICAEPGEYTYDMSSEPSIFTGSLGRSILDTFASIGKRISHGGDTGKEQRVYYFNTKEIQNNTFGTASPLPFRVVDEKIGLDVDISIRCNGQYSYRVADPILFYTNVCGNVQEIYTSEQIDRTLRSEFMNALQPAFARISEMGVRYSAIPAHTMELCDALNEVLSQKWRDLRGIEIVSISFNAVNASKEDEELIKNAQRNAQVSLFNSNTQIAAGTLVAAQAEAMKNAASNAGGAMNGFMGINFAGNPGGVNAGTLFQMGAQQQTPQQTAAPTAETWVCSCGTTNTGKFCTECANPKPAPAVGWTCQCGTVNQGKFCPNCGSPKPADAPLYRCDKCGWQPKDPKHPPKFCPECGDIFDTNDAQ